MCSRIGTLAVSLALVSVASAALCRGQSAPDQSSDPTVVKLKPVNAEAASAVNFNRALGLSFESLNSLGQRIDQARRVSDPIALASAARELAVAEAVSGKKAGLRSADVMKEAVELAEQRKDPSELKALAFVADDDSAKKRLEEKAKAAEDHQADRAARLKSGERSRGLNGTLRIFNNTDDRGTVYLNGAYFGWVNPKPPSVPDNAWFHDYYVNDRLDAQTTIKVVTSDGKVFMGYAEDPRNFLAVYMVE